MSKKLLSAFMALCMAVTMLLPAFPLNARGATSISTNDLFMTYPAYLSNSEMDEGLAKASEAYYAVINSYSDSDETLAAYMTAFSEGISLLLKEGASKLGWTESMYEQYAREAATKYMQSMLTDENTIKKASKSVETAYKTLKTSYSIGSAIDKARLEQDLSGIANEYDIGISKADMEELVGNLYDSGTLKQDLKAIGVAVDLWKIVFEMTELHAIEMATMDLLLDELDASGQTNSDLYLGLNLLKNDINKNQAHYVLERYGTKHILKFLSGKVDDLIGMISGTAVSIVTVCTKVFADYIYVNAKADDITQAIMQTSFVSSIDICLSQYRLKFLQGKGTTADIETYEQLYGAYLSAIKCTLDSCYDLSKITDKFSLGGDCMVWSDELKYTYTYDKYIEWCKEEVAHDIENATLDTSGSSTITDALNEETIRANFERVYRLYPPNSGEIWNGNYDGAKSSLGFAAKIFNHLFDKTISPRVQNDYQYILTNNRNVRLIGRLEEASVTANALKDLFSNARIGDVVISSGQYDYLHAMILTEVTDNGIIVYDCDSKYTEEKSYTGLIQQYELSYKKMADAFSKNGDYHQKPGLSVYRAIKKINTANSGSSLTDAEYDDSVNYIIENGVLTGYKGSRTTLQIPDGVTEIGAHCFENNRSIECIYMPNSIVKINEYALYGMLNLQEVYLSKGIKEIGTMAFCACQRLNKINISASNLKIGENAFNSCGFLNRGIECVYITGENIQMDSGAFSYNDNLERIYISGKNIQIGNAAFLSNPKLKEVYISGDNHQINAEAFYECYSLESVSMEDSVTHIGMLAFNGCTRLTQITIPSTIEAIDYQAFRNCTRLQDIYLPSHIFSLSNAFENTAFYNTEENWEDGGLYIGSCLVAAKNNDTETFTIKEGTKNIAGEIYNGLEVYRNVTMPDSVIRIGDNAFFDCSHLENIVLSKNLLYIGEGAFSNCKALQEVDCGNSLTYIGGRAFQFCTKLSKINLPETLQSIGDRAFQGCNNLLQVFYTGGQKEWETILMGQENSSLADSFIYYNNEYYNGIQMKKVLAYNTENVAQEYISVRTNAEDALPLLAGYDGQGKLIRLTTFREGSSALYKYTDCKTVKAFLFESPETLEPLCAPAILENK